MEKTVNKKHLKIVSEAIKRLNGEQLRTVTREGSMGDFSFGDFVEKTVHRYDANKVLVPKTVSIPRFALHIDGCFRMTCADEIILAKVDMFEPSSKKESERDFDWENFEWDSRGDNRFDEVSERYFHEVSHDFVVKKAIVNRWGDVKILFENSFVLEVFIDRTASSECWRFFESGAEEHIVVTGQGLEEYDESEID